MDVSYKSLEFMGFPKYRVGDDGSVWSCHWGYWHRLKPGADGDGYLFVNLRGPGARGLFKIHRLVLLAFVGPCPTGMQVRHFPDRDVTNNNLANLSWGTPKENQTDRITHGTRRFRSDGGGVGVRHRNAKLNPEKVRIVREMHKNGESKGEIARKLAVSWQTIDQVIRGVTWAHVQDIEEVY